MQSQGLGQLPSPRLRNASKNFVKCSAGVRAVFLLDGFIVKLLGEEYIHLDYIYIYIYICVCVCVKEKGDQVQSITC